MILVAGGTGMLGTRLVRQLTGRGLPVRVLTRDPARARGLAASHVEVFEGDVRVAADVERAVTGCDIVVSAIHGFVGTGRVSPESVDRDGNVKLIDAAAKAGAAFVLTSIVGATADSPMDLFRAKFAAEEHLRASSVSWTIVRATAFAETWCTIMGEPLRAKNKTIVFGRGDNPINFVSVVDVAALLELAVVDPTLRGRVIDLGGPENVTFNEFADRLRQVAQSTGSVNHIPRAMLRMMGFVMGPLNPQFARQARAGVVMDTDDMTFDAAPARRSLPDLPNTNLTTAMTEHWREATLG